MAERPVQDVRAELITSFGDYHSPIQWQTDLVDELVREVAREERERCADVAEQSAHAEPEGSGRVLGLAIAAKLRDRKTR